MELYWFALDIPRYESKTSHLTMLQDGAYNRLMRHYYKTCAPIPLAELQIVIICKAFSQEEIAAVSYILETYFRKESDGWHHDTCDEEIAKARKLRTLKQKQGRKGGLAKARNSLQRTASETPSETLHNNNNNNNNKEPKVKTKAASAFVIPDWIPMEEWLAFEEMRQKMRKPMTDKARSLILTTLHRLRSHGQAPKLVLEQSIRKGWQDVFELKGEHGTNRPDNQAQPRAVERYHNNRARFAEAFGESAMGASAGANGAGHAADVRSGPGGLLEAGVGEIQRHRDN